MTGRRRLLRWLLLAVVGLAVLVVAVPYAYIHLVRGPAPSALSVGTAAPDAVSTASAAPADGTWTVGSGSRAGYRVTEVLAGQDTVAVGRTDDVTGTLTVRGGALQAGTFTVDLRTVTSDQSRRDAQFRGRIMETATYPTAVFELAGPVDLGDLATRDGRGTLEVPGRLTLHGVTRAVTARLTAVRTGETVEVSGQLPVTFADHGIEDPSIGGFVTTRDRGTLEVLLRLTRG